MTLKKTLPLPSDQERLRRFTRAHSPFQSPRFSGWHGLLGMALAALLLGQQQAPGLFADLGTYVIGGWEAGILARVTVILLSALAMLAVRTLHPLGYLAMCLSVFGVALRLGEVRMTHEPLTLGFAVVLLALALYAVRIITRQPELRTGERP